jgi:hypothetical protein
MKGYLNVGITKHCIHFPCDGVTAEGFRLVTGFTEPLQIVTTSNYSAIANSHTQQFNTARTIVYFFIASWVGLSPLYCGHFWPIVPASDYR